MKEKKPKVKQQETPVQSFCVYNTDPKVQKFLKKIGYVSSDKSTSDPQNP